MSNQFIQFEFPCTDCLVNAACKDKRNDSFKENNKDVEFERSTCLAIPKKDASKSYHKVLLECAVNMCCDIRNSIDKLDEQGHQKKDNLPFQYVMLFCFTIDVLGHMVNTTSWEKGKLYDFDRLELKRKLKHVINLL